jgi:hypothetical protein
MPAYDPRGGDNVHIDKVLSNISVGWLNQITNVASALFPPVTVQKQSDLYYTFGRETWQQTMGGDVRPPGGVANEIPGVRVSTDAYFCKEHALQIAVTPEERANADSPLDPDQEATELVTKKIILGRELAARALVHDENNYLASHVETLTGTDQWNDGNSDPIGLFRELQRTFHQTLFTLPNVAVIPWRVMHYLEDHPAAKERIKYVRPQTPAETAQVVGTMLGVERVVVPGGGYDSANPGQPNDLSYVWGEHVILAYVPPRPALKTPAFGYEFVWPLYGNPQYTDRWWDVERKADVIRTGRSYDLKIVAKDGDYGDGDKSIAGMLIKNAIDPEAD